MTATDRAWNRSVAAFCRATMGVATLEVELHESTSAEAIWRKQHSEIVAARAADPDATVEQLSERLILPVSVVRRHLGLDAVAVPKLGRMAAQKERLFRQMVKATQAV